MKKLGLPAFALIGVGLFAGSTLGVAAQDDHATDAGPELITEELRPGVELVLRDDAGHDLTERHPNHHRDMDLIAIDPIDGTVWIASSVSGADNELLFGHEVWAIGRRGIAVLEGEFLDTMLVRPDGTLTGVTNSGIYALDGDEWRADPGTKQWTTYEGTTWLIEPEDLPGPDLWSDDDGIGVLATHWDGRTWSTVETWGQELVDVDAGRWRIDPDGGIDGEVDGLEFSLLEDTGINMIAVDLDGLLWAIGGIGDESGGVYRIDTVVAAEAASDDADTTIA